MQFRWLAAMLVLICIMGVGTASHNNANWNLYDMEIASETAGNQSEVTVLVSLEDSNGDPIAPDTFDQGIRMAYSYDKFDEFQYDFTYLNASDNRYVTQVPVTKQDGTIDIYAWYDGNHDTFPTNSNEGPHINKTFDPTANYSVELTHDKPADRHWYWAVENHTENIEIDVYNQTGYTPTSATVNWTLYDWSGIEITNGSASEGSGTFNTTLTFPEPTNDFYYMDIEVWENGNRTGGGSESFMVDEQLIVNIPEMVIMQDNPKCQVMPPGGNPDQPDLNIFSALCEKGVSFNITVNEQRNNVSAPFEWWVRSLEKIKGDDSYNWTVHEGRSTLTEQGNGVWETSVDIPRFLNTTVNGTTPLIQQEAYAGTPADFHDNLVTYDHYDDPDAGSIVIDITPFDISSRTADFLEVGKVLEIREELRLPFSDETIERKEIHEVNFTIRNDTGHKVFNTTIGGGETFPEDHFDVGGTIRYDWDSPSDLETGDYTLYTDAEDQFGESVNHSHTFTVTEKKEITGTNASQVIIRDIGSSVSDYDDRLDKTFNEPGNRSGSLLLKNNVSDANEDPTVNITIPDSLNETITINHTEGKGIPFTMAPNEIDELEVNLSLDAFGSVNDTINITVEDSDGNYTVDLPVDYTVERDCVISNGTACVQREAVDYSFDIAREETIELPIDNLAGEPVNFTMGTEGNLSSVVDDVTEEIESYGTADLNQTIDIGRDENGFYKGNLTVHENGSNIVRVATTITMDVPEGALDVTIEDRDFGSVVLGETFELDVTINNTGDIMLDDMTMTIDEFNVSEPVVDGNDAKIALESGTNTTLTLEIDTGDATAEEYTVDDPLTLEVKETDGPRGEAIFFGNLVNDIGDDITSLNNDLDDVNTLLTDESNNITEDDLSDFEGQTSDLRGQIEDANEAWNNGNYDEAQSQYSDIQSSITTLESQIETAASEGGGNTGGNETGTGGDDETTNDGGGFSILMIIIPLLLIIIIGVVVYLSIVPDDEGEQESSMDYGPPT